MSSVNGINILFGAGTFGSFTANVIGTDAAHDLARTQLDVLTAEGVESIVTSELYAGSEQELASHDAPARFRIQTKLTGGLAAGRTAEDIVKAGKERLRLLNTEQVEVLCIHAPDGKTPVAEQVKGYGELYRQGAFKKLGLSNFSASEVQEFHDAAAASGCVLPTVFEGFYCATGRKAEDELLPVLRRLGISFNAYSPVGGGLLARTREDIEGGASRFDPESFYGQMYQSLFNKPSFLEAVDAWGAIAEGEGITRVELALRWVVYHSALEGKHGDGIIIGARDAAQLRESLSYVRAGPLSEEAAKKASDVWLVVREDAALDHWNGYMKKVLQG